MQEDIKSSAPSLQLKREKVGSQGFLTVKQTVPYKGQTCSSPSACPKVVLNPQPVRRRRRLQTDWPPSTPITEEWALEGAMKRLLPPISGCIHSALCRSSFVTWSLWVSKTLCPPHNPTPPPVGLWFLCILSPTLSSPKPACSKWTRSVIQAETETVTIRQCQETPAEMPRIARPPPLPWHRCSHCPGKKYQIPSSSWRGDIARLIPKAQPSSSAP